MSDKKIVLKWKGKKIETYGDMWDAATEITDPQEAEAFIQAHEEAGVARDVFLSNLGYWAGYYDESARRRVFDVFGAVHPVFGMNFRPSPEEAFRLGQEMAERGIGAFPTFASPGPSKLTAKRLIEL